MPESFHPLHYAEEHPYIAGAVVFGGGLVLLWALGYIGGRSSTSADAATQSMAAAYYAAEAAQLQAGTALNIATVQANAQTQGALINAQGAVAINQSNNTASTAIANSMYAADIQDTKTTTDAATAQAGLMYAAQTQQAGFSAQTQQVQANDAYATSVAANNYAYLTTQSNNQAGVWNTAFNTVIPAEVARTGDAIFNLGGYGTANIANNTVPNVQALIQQGYSPAQASMIAATSSGIAGLSTGTYP